MKIGPHEIGAPALMLAPMAGYSDLPFRELARTFGCDYAVAEMTASREDLREREKSLTRWVEAEESGLHVVQLLGADPAVMAEAPGRLKRTARMWWTSTWGARRGRCFPRNAGARSCATKSLFGTFCRRSQVR